jgi:hypothetical protein
VRSLPLEYGIERKEEYAKMSSSASDLMYALQEVPGKSKGLVATRKIPMGTRILSEEPIIRVPEAALDSQTLLESIRRQADALTPDQRRAFLSMHNIHADDAASRYLGIIRTNALPFGDDVREVGIFLDACRINHACDNNAQKAGTRTSNGTPSMHCEISRRARRSQFTTSASSTTAKPAKRLFEENSRLPARVVFAPCHQIRAKKAIEGWMRSSS